MRILFVPGINTPAVKLSGWEKELRQFFPKAEIIFLQSWYLHWQHEEIEKLVQEGIHIVEDKKKTILLAHSFGGILSKAIIHRAKKANICGLITMASPHHMDSFGVKNASQKINAPRTVSIPSVSFGGYFDPIVPFPKTVLSKKYHWNFSCEHLAFLFSSPIRKDVLKKSIQTFREISPDMNEI